MLAKFIDDGDSHPQSKESMYRTIFPIPGRSIPSFSIHTYHYSRHADCDLNRLLTPRGGRWNTYILANTHQDGQKLLTRKVLEEKISRGLIRISEKRSDNAASTSWSLMTGRSLRDLLTSTTSDPLPPSRPASGFPYHMRTP